MLVPPGGRQVRGLLLELLCWLNGGHFPRREPMIVGFPPRWVTRVRCDCGALDQTVEGLIDHPWAGR